ncbi:uncharacterized protein LOC126834566 [Adelges cooleyi]|uniref:uncharacterized protein LOC126834566 n=1 Tax=Adelges cooleyi TaxID=133065 RepID=UPI00218014CA|nr:uncharacterized protein LOC126834566 [Adelges cooleyi]
MSGQIVFSHNIGHPIADLALYREIIDGIRSNGHFDVVHEPITTWKNTTIVERFNNDKWVSQNDVDYAFGIELKKSKYHSSLGARHCFVLFPKNPNTHRVISVLHAKGLNCDTVDFAEELEKFQKAFPETFSLVRPDDATRYGQYYLSEDDYYSDNNNFDSPVGFASCSLSD